MLRAQGEDTLDFLQGQFSQDLKKLESGRAAYGFWLNQKGKVLGDSWVRVDSPESCLIATLSMTPVALAERLEAYIIADDVELEDQSEDWSAWWVTGPTAQGGLDAQSNSSGGLLGVIEQRPELGWYFAKESPIWPDGWTEGATADWSRCRIALGWPEVPRDLGADDLPQEGGIPEASVALNKGCYLGQEVMARIDATGRVRRCLRTVVGRGTTPEGDRNDIFQDGRVVAELRSRIENSNGTWTGLAMVSLARWSDDHPATLADGQLVELLSAEEAAD